MKRIDHNIMGPHCNRLISQIPQCTSPISHNVPLCNRNVHTCAHFFYKMVHCGISVWCIVGFVRCVYWQSMACNFQAAVSMKSMASALTGNTSNNDSIEGAGQIFTEVGTFRGVTVAIRKVMKEEILLTRENLLEMKIVSLSSVQECIYCYICALNLVL